MGEHVLGEGRERELNDGFAILGEPRGRLGRAADERGQTQVRATGEAVFAISAPGIQATDDVIAHGHLRYVWADGLDDSGRLVAEHAGCRHRDGALYYVQIAVTDAGGCGPGQHFVGTGLVDLDFFDLERRVERAHDGGFHDFLH